MARKSVRYGYVRRDFMRCSCWRGICPNYDPVLCQVSGGKRIKPERGYSDRIKEMKHLLQTDINMQGGQS